MSLNVGVVGATGVVGETFLQLLDERKFPVDQLRLFASSASAGSKIKFQNREVSCQTLDDNCFQELDLVFFSSGDDISKEWAPKAIAAGAFAIDNSAAFRMSEKHKLIVPEINGHLLPKATDTKEIIANPNCSTIQLVMALSPLAQEFGLSSVRVATYQSVSGAGRDGRAELIEQLKNQLAESQQEQAPQVFSHQIAFNALPHIGGFDDQGFSSEENKIMNETRKIMNSPELNISAFCVRVPSLNGHGEAVWVTLSKETSLKEIETCLNQFPGLNFVPHNQAEQFPTPISTDEQNPVYVGRVHLDPNNPKSLIMWVVADNLRKGAALNGLQIAEKIFC